MEKLFHPNKWFVLFCALLVVIWVFSQFVSDLRICDEAKFVGAKVFTWTWPELKYESFAEMKRAEVMKRNATEAIVKVEGRQVITKLSPEEKLNKSQTIDCQAILSFYRVSNKWILGRVELK